MPKTQVGGAYLIGMDKTNGKMKTEAVVLFNGISEDEIESTITHEYIHRAFLHIGENPAILDGFFRTQIAIPFGMLITIWSEGSEDEVEGLEASLKISDRQIRRKFRKKQYVVL